MPASARSGVSTCSLLHIYVLVAKSSHMLSSCHQVDFQKMNPVVMSKK